MHIQKKHNTMLKKACIAPAVCAFMLSGFAKAEAQDANAPIPQNDMTENQDMAKSVAILRALDKITARITELQVPTGDEGVTFGNLLIKSPQCRSNPPEETPESFVLLTIDELKKDGKSQRIFSGWMLASSPALNPLEHPVYDVWAINCRTVSGAGSE